MHFIKYLNNLSACPLAVPALHQARRVTVTVRRTLINRKMLTFFCGGARHYGGAVCCAATCCRNFSGSLMGQTRQAVCTIRAPAELESRRGGEGGREQDLPFCIYIIYARPWVSSAFCTCRQFHLCFPHFTLYILYILCICVMLVCRS